MCMCVWFRASTCVCQCLRVYVCVNVCMYVWVPEKEEDDETDDVCMCVCVYSTSIVYYYLREKRTMRQMMPNVASGHLVCFILLKVSYRLRQNCRLGGC